jgi:Protein of unknown function (DUF2844)
MDAGVSGTSPRQASGERMMSPKPDTTAAVVNQMTRRLSNICKGEVMPMLQSTVSKSAALGAAVLIAALIPHVASATLGQPETTVQTDVAQAHAAIKSMQDRTRYRVHEIQLPSGTVMREFVAPDGNVFAVAWQGPTRPDLRQALGQYFDAYASAPRSKFADRRHVQIQQGDLVLQSGGHMRALTGRAYLLSAIPSGVNIGDLH